MESSDGDGAKAPDLAAGCREETSTASQPYRPRIWIPVVLCLGLLIAAGYVGGRIRASRLQVARPVAVTRPQAPQPAAVPAPAAEESATPKQVVAAAAAEEAGALPDSDPAPPGRSGGETAGTGSGEWSLITPQPGERYIQISAWNAAVAHLYVGELRRNPREPHLAPGPTPDLVRVLIGPFHDSTSLQTAMADLKATGTDCFIREY